MKHRGIKDETVIEKTGKSLVDWFAVLDGQGAKKWSHKQIADWLIEKQQLGGWWAQTITVEYEFHHGKRVIGQTKDAGFQVGAQKTMPLAAEELWDFLLSPEGTELLLGSSVEVPLTKGETFTAGSWRAEIRSVDEGAKLRMRLESKQHPASTLQIYVLPAGAHKASLRLHHEKLVDADHRAKMKTHWQSVLEQIKAYITKRKHKKESL